MMSVQNLYTKKRSLELDWEQHYVQEGIYTLDMVRIDEEIRRIINQIEYEERMVKSMEGVNAAFNNLSTLTGWKTPSFQMSNDTISLSFCCRFMFIQYKCNHQRWLLKDWLPMLGL